MPIGRQLGADILNIGDEPHVEHAVCFIDDEKLTASEQDFAPLKQIHQPARRRDQNIDALFQRLNLIPHLHTANKQGHGKLVIFAIFLKILGNLSGEFARWF